MSVMIVQRDEGRLIGQIQALGKLGHPLTVIFLRDPCHPLLLVLCGSFPPTLLLHGVLVPLNFFPSLKLTLKKW